MQMKWLQEHGYRKKHKNMAAKNVWNKKGYGKETTGTWLQKHVCKWDGCKKMFAKERAAVKQTNSNMAAENSMQRWLQKNGYNRKGCMETKKQWHDCGKFYAEMAAEKRLQQKGLHGNQKTYHGCGKILCRGGCRKMAATKTATEKTLKRTCVATNAYLRWLQQNATKTLGAHVNMHIVYYETLTLQSLTFLVLGGFQLSMSRPQATSMTRMVSSLFPRWVFGIEENTSIEKDD